MNHVELSGLIAEPVVAHKVNEQIVHAEFQLQTRHKNRAGEWQKERYIIHCWNRLADWANENLHQGDLVAVDGRLHIGKTTLVTQCFNHRFSFFSYGTF